MPQPGTKPGGGGGGEVRGLVARLVQKEKQVSQLQREIERLRVEKPSERVDQVEAYILSLRKNTNRMVFQEEQLKRERERVKLKKALDDNVVWKAKVLVW